VLLAMPAFLTACGGDTGAGTVANTAADGMADTPTDTAAVPPVYVTVALHIEDTPVYANCDAYPGFREKLLKFAEAIAPYGAAVNLQTDYEFLVGASRCEKPHVQ
jgi:hypothetical protein